MASKSGGCKKKRRTPRQSLGREGHPHKVGRVDGMARLLNQINAFKAGKRVRMVVPKPIGAEGITINGVPLTVYLAKKNTKFEPREASKGKVLANEIWGKNARTG